jgi:hypothetical protein
MNPRAELQTRDWRPLGLLLAAAAAGCPTSGYAQISLVPPSPNAPPNTIAVYTALQAACSQIPPPPLPTSPPNVPVAEQDLQNQCVFFSNGQNALSAGYAAIGGQQINALGPQTKIFASLQQDNLAEQLADLRQGSQDESVSGLILRGSGDRLLAATNVMDFLPYDSSGGTSTLPKFLQDKLGFFVNGSIQLGDQAPTSNSFLFGIKNATLSAGADYRVSDSLFVGAVYGLGATSVNFTDNLGRLDLRENGFTLFASFYEHSFFVDLVKGYGISRLTTDRNLYLLVPGQEAMGRSHLHDQWEGISFGDDLRWRWLFVSPEGSLNYHESHLDAFTESMSQPPPSPGSDGALSYGSATISSLQGRLGVRGGATWGTAWGVFQPLLRWDYIHEFQCHADTFSASFAAAQSLPPGAGLPFYIHTDAPEANYFSYSLGLNATFAYGFSASFDYKQLLGLQSIKSHEISLRVRYQGGK